jgi:hypothetical protein
LAASCQAILLAIGSAFAIASLMGEVSYSFAMETGAPAEAVMYLRSAADFYPGSRIFRQESALYLSKVADSQPDKGWKEAALAELYHALATDKTSPSLLYNMRRMEIALGRQPTHEPMFDYLARISEPMKKVKTGAVPE